MLKRRTVLLAKEESNYGVDPTPDGANNSLIGIDVKVKENPGAESRDDAMTPSMSNRAALLGNISTEIVFQVELKGSGTRGTAARIGDLLEACGFTETIVAGSSVNYTPGSSSFKSVTIYAYIDGRLHKSTGCRGNVKITAAAGKRALLEFSMKGIYVAPTDVALSTITGTLAYETTVPPICKGLTFSLNAVTTLVVQQFELDMAVSIASRESLSAAYGFAGFDITGRKPSLSINPESVPIATYDYRADLLTTPRAVSLAIGATAGNVITISGSKFNTENIEYGDRDGVLIETIKGSLVQTADIGNDEVTISFT